jgi:CRP/FNR family cyclic AMP-dependent transcriptional regulator
MTDTWQTKGFAGRLGPEELHCLLSSGRPVTFPPTTTILHDGSLLLIRKGEVKLVASSGRLLDVRGPGDLVGEVPYLTGLGPTSIVVALRSREVEAVSVGYPEFTEFLDRFPQAGLHVARFVAARLRTDQNRLELTGYGVTDRVVRALVDMASVFGPEIPLTQLEISQLIGLSQVSVQRTLRELSALGLTKRGYRRVVVPCVGCLAAMGTATSCPFHRLARLAQ